MGLYDISKSLYNLCEVYLKSVKSVKSVGLKKNNGLYGNYANLWDFALAIELDDKGKGLVDWKKV